MRTMRGASRTLEDCLSADAGLARLSAHARRLLHFQAVFESATPLARQARVANLKSGKVVIHAANGAVAAKLRQVAPRLVSVFSSEGAEVTGIDIKVQPGTATPPTMAHKARTAIGSKQKQALTLLLEGLPEGSPLRSALTRLLKNT